MKEFFERHKMEAYAILGLLFAVFLFMMSRKSSGGSQQSVNIPYMVPEPLKQSATDINGSGVQSISEQQNIIGSHTNNVVPNGSVPSHFSHGWIEGNTNGRVPIATSNAGFTQGQLAGTEPITSRQGMGTPVATYYNPTTGTIYRVE